MNRIWGSMKRQTIPLKQDATKDFFDLRRTCKEKQRKKKHDKEHDQQCKINIKANNMTKEI